MIYRNGKLITEVH
jgi:hypothetical protein